MIPLCIHFVKAYSPFIRLHSPLSDFLFPESFIFFVPLRFAPLHAPERFDERAGLVTRLAPNIARVNAVLAVTVPTGQGRRMIERIEVM